MNITNSDNRLLASAVRIAIEPCLSRIITPDQRGFLPGRSMIANILDVDEGMLEAAMAGEGAQAICSISLPPSAPLSTNGCTYSSAAQGGHSGS